MLPKDPNVLKDGEKKDQAGFWFLNHVGKTTGVLMLSAKSL